MNFTTRQIAELLGAGSHGPDCAVHHVVIDPSGVELNQAWIGWNGRKGAAKLGRQRILLDNQRWVNGPSVETMLRRLAADERGRPATGDRVGVLGATAPWATAALTRAALGSLPAGDGLPPPGHRTGARSAERNDSACPSPS